MDKELKMLEDWLDGKINEDEISIFDSIYLKKLKSFIIKLKQIEDAEPNDAMRKLDDISYLVLNEIDDLKNKELWKQYLETIKQTLLKVQEFEEVFEVIKHIIESGDDLGSILNFDTYEEYNEWSCEKYKVDYKVGYKLTQQEFELLKKYFK